MTSTYLNNTAIICLLIVADLQGHLKGLDSGTAGTILLTVWLLLGYFLYKVTSTGTSFFVMSILLLAHSIYGQTWCLYQLCIVAGKCSRPPRCQTHGREAVWLHLENIESITGIMICIRLPVQTAYLQIRITRFKIWNIRLVSYVTSSYQVYSAICYSSLGIDPHITVC